MVVISDYAKGTVTDRLLRWLLREARSRGLTTLVDPKRTDMRAYHGATLLTPNLREAALALGKTQLSTADAHVGQAAQRLRHRSGAENILLTRGAHGMTLATPEATHHFPALTQQVSDVTGAGDTVVAMLAVALAEGQNLVTAAERANLAASLAVAKVGTQPVYREEFEQLLHTRHSEHKVMSWEEARQRVVRWRQTGQQIVLTNGCFDLLHAGHIHCLEAARREGDRLIVALNNDASVRDLKGFSRPLVAEQHRAAVLAALACVDAVVLFEDDTPSQLIELLSPDVLVKGGDYRVEDIAGSAHVLSHGGRVVIVPLLPELSTSRIVQTATQHLADRGTSQTM